MTRLSKMDRWILSMGIALLLVAAAAVYEDFAARCAAVRQDTLRLHIIANSDSEEDQRNKLLVRDALLERYSPLLARGGDAQEAAAIAEALHDDIILTAKAALERQGDANGVAAEVTEMYFDTRSYDEGVTLPAGNYAALRVVIGEGKGKNWWCVMYPPLCIPATGKRQAEEIELRIRALSEAPGCEARFAVVELAEKLKTAFLRLS